MKYIEKINRRSSLVKIGSSELEKISTKKLLEMKRQMEIHLSRAFALGNKEKIGFNINEEKKNIARVNTILRARESKKDNNIKGIAP